MPREYRREAWEMAMRRNRAVRWLVSWLPHRVTIALRTVLRWEHSLIAKVRLRWHRSLQLRVIATTLVISATMVAILGFFLTEQIADGLLANAETSAHNQALAGLDTARSLPDFNAAPATYADAQTFMYNAWRTLEPPPGNGNTSYYVVVGLRSDYRQVFDHWITPTVDHAATLPATLIEDVKEEQLATHEDLLYYTPTTLTF